jgi:hypothetical protein
MREATVLNLAIQESTDLPRFSELHIVVVPAVTDVVQDRWLKSVLLFDTTAEIDETKFVIEINLVQDRTLEQIKIESLLVASTVEPVSAIDRPKSPIKRFQRRKIIQANNPPAYET